MLARLADLKVRLDTPSGSAQDAALTAALTGAGALIAAWCDRTIEYAATDLVEDLDCDGETWDLLLRCWPVVDVPAAPVVRESASREFGGAALSEGRDYYLARRRGVLTRLPIGRRWTRGRGTVRITYRGGYLDPAAQAVTGVAPVPAHIQEACLLQAVELYRRRGDPGYKVVAGMPEGISAGYAPPVELLPAARELLRGERR